MRATALIFRELERVSIGICALSEVLRPGVEKSNTIFWSGGKEREQLELVFPSQIG